LLEISNTGGNVSKNFSSVDNQGFAYFPYDGDGVREGCQFFSELLGFMNCSGTGGDGWRNLGEGFFNFLQSLSDIAGTLFSEEFNCTHALLDYIFSIIKALNKIGQLHTIESSFNETFHNLQAFRKSRCKLSLRALGPFHYKSEGSSNLISKVFVFFLSEILDTRLDFVVDFNAINNQRFSNRPQEGQGIREVVNLVN